MVFGNLSDLAFFGWIFSDLPGSHRARFGCGQKSFCLLLLQQVDQPKYQAQFKDSAKICIYIYICIHDENLMIIWWYGTKRHGYFQVLLSSASGHGSRALTLRVRLTGKECCCNGRCLFQPIPYSEATPKPTEALSPIIQSSTLQVHDNGVCPS